MEELAPFTLVPGSLRLSQIEHLLKGGKAIRLSADADLQIHASAAAVQTVIERNEVVYGINTGFGSLAHTRITSDKVADLQRRLVLSHATGVGEHLPDCVVRLIILLKVNALARGYSGVRRSVIDALIALLNAEVYPRIPAKGSVGASGDLAPLAHMSAILLGIGEVKHRGHCMPAADGLKIAGLEPMQLAAKEGLALLNGTQASTALAAFGLLGASCLFNAATIAGALSNEACLGSDTPFDERIHQVRGQLGQIEVARCLRALLKGSDLRESHRNCSKVQDPYSLRCQPQVMGACLDMLRFAAATIEREINAVSDNPIVFASDGDVISGGNFHAEPVAMAADVIAIAIAEIGALSERRIALLTDAKMSGLPPFLVKEPGLNSGYMIAHVTAAALASENKCLAHPASVDSLPTSANQEDHVSMAAYAARRLGAMVENASFIVAIELLAAVQGIDLRAPLRTTARLEVARVMVRRCAEFWEEDREMAPDINRVKDLVTTDPWRSLVTCGVLQA